MRDPRTIEARRKLLAGVRLEWERDLIDTSTDLAKLFEGFAQSLDELGEPTLLERETAAILRRRTDGAVSNADAVGLLVDLYRRHGKQVWGS